MAKTDRPQLPSDSPLAVPFLKGWRREVVQRQTGGGSDAYYFGPSGKKYRSIPEILRAVGPDGKECDPTLGRENFSFSKNVLGYENSELDIFRSANIKSQLIEDLQDSSGSQPSLPPTPSFSRKRKKKSLDTTDEPVELASSHLKRAENDEEMLVKSWAAKLTRMDQHQRRLAERIINDVLLDGEMGSLSWEGMRFATANRPWAQPTTSRMPQFPTGQNQCSRLPPNVQFLLPPEYSISPPSYCPSPSDTDGDEQTMTTEECFLNNSSS